MISFRNDLNFLRAISVLIVTLYHFEVPLFNNGFLGVDIFFMISGYLMTAIILKNNSFDSFNYFKFLRKRFIRIAPALIFISLVLLIYGWLFIPKIYLTDILNEIIKSNLFISNIYYRRDLDYFSGLKVTKWMLHSWTLSLELQFYILYPFILLYIKNNYKNKLLEIFISMTILGILLSTLITYIRHDISFYLLPTRFWEFTSGTCLYLANVKKNEINNSFKIFLNSNYIFLLILFLFIISMLIPEFNKMSPGIITLLPIVASGLIVLSNNKFANSFFQNKIFFWLGTRSFSIYLWHWPVIVLLHYYALSPFLILGAGLLLTILFSEFSYRYIESIKHVSFLIFLYLILFISIILINDNMNNRIIESDEKAQYLNNYTKANFLPNLNEIYNNKCNFFDDIDSQLAKEKISSTCVSEFENNILLIGDSHAQALSYGIKSAVMKNTNFNFSQITSSGCKFGEVFNYLVYEIQKACKNANDYLKEYITENKPNIVIISQINSHDSESVYNLISYMNTLGIFDIYLIGPIPQWNIELPKIIAQSYWESKGFVIDNHSSFRYELVDLDNASKAIFLENKYRASYKYISLLDEYCDKDLKCLMTIDNKRTPFVWDNSHLTPSASIIVGNYIIEYVLEVK